MAMVELTYRKVGDVYLQEVELPPQPKVNLNMYGRARLSYLEEHDQLTHHLLFVKCQLSQHLAEIQEQAAQMEETLTKQLKEQEGVTEKLKENDQMEWVRRMNSIRDRVREIIFSELIYV